ncbi:MAG: hypothetical protein NTV34_04725, partial [Proteobacteria bacterium]|nr:hypothetical protein [Pseudomonadota bacterium]
MKNLIVLLPMFLVGLSSAQALQSDPIAVALEQPQREPMSVVLLDEEVPLSAQDIVFTVSPRLNVAYKDSQGGARQFMRNVE